MELKIQQQHFASRAIIVIVILLLSILLYIVPRADFIATFSIYSGIFCFYVFINKRENLFSFRHCIALGIVLRLIALFSLPALSDDYFRFIWDGKMIISHVNPFAYTPQEYVTINHLPYLQHLYNSMNSQEYHTIYPPVLQFIFATAAFLGKGSDWLSVLVMKIFIVAAEIGTIRILYLLANKIGIPSRQIIWYWLNPLIIVELTGNVHFEGVLIFFFACFLYFLYSNKLVLSAIFFMLAVCTKMIPLMLAPLLISYLGIKRAIYFGAVSVVTGVLLFLPFFNWHLLKDIDSSLHLFFHLFEFNASVFYFIRWVGYFYVKYDIIEQVAPVLGILTLLIIVWISFRRIKYSFVEKSMWIFSVYFLLSTMVHPWYSSILILLSALGRFRYPIVFSLLIMLSYYPYSLKEYNEETGLWWIALEYGLLFSYVAWEAIAFKRKSLGKEL